MVLKLRNLGPHHHRGHGQAQQQRDEVGQHLLRRLRERIEYQTLAQEVPNIRNPTSATLLGGNAGDEGDEDGEEMRVVREMLAGLYSIFIRRSFWW